MTEVTTTKDVEEGPEDQEITVVTKTKKTRKPKRKAPKDKPKKKRPKKTSLDEQIEDIPGVTEVSEHTSTDVQKIDDEEVETVTTTKKNQTKEAARWHGSHRGSASRDSREG